MTKNAVERSLEELRDLWSKAADDPRARIIVWRIPQSSGRLLSAFFEAQKHPGDWQAPDLFIPIHAPFETGFSYSRTLREELQGRYEASRDDLREDDVAADWPDAKTVCADSPAGTLALCASFAKHHQRHFRHLVLVLQPDRVLTQEAFTRWLDGALATPIAPNVRLALVDELETRALQPVVERHGEAVRVIEAPLDMFDLARELAAQSGGSGPQVALRQMFAELMTLLERGSPERLEQRAARALALAERQQWPDQQVAVYMMIAGGWLKARDFQQSIAAYRHARESAQQAQAAQHPVANDLHMQTWFGEASVWFAAGHAEQAAEAYRQAALAAAKVPNPMFVIEGHRMAAYCLAGAGLKTRAIEQGSTAIRTARALPKADRPMTTLALALDDMMKLQDPERAEKLGEIAKNYEARCLQLHAEAENSAARLGPRPAAADIASIEKHLHAELERAFHQAAQERERLIQKGDEFFRKLVAVGRESLHPQWNGLPDIQHPLDHDVPAWTDPPASQPLPEPGDLQPVIEQEAA